MNRVNKTNWKYKIFNICSRATLKETFMAKYEIYSVYTPRQDEEHPRPCHMEVPFPPSSRESDRLLLVYVLWFSFILCWNFIFLCFGVR